MRPPVSSPAQATRIRYAGWIEFTSCVRDRAGLSSVIRSNVSPTTLATGQLSLPQRLPRPSTLTC